MNKPNISVSLIKSMRNIDLSETCPARVKAIQIDKIYDPKDHEPQDAMKLGQYFEYLLTGATLRDGTIPQAEMTKAGKMAAAYENVQCHKATWEDIVKGNKYIALQTSVLLEANYKGYNLKGIADVVCLQGDKPVIIDIKSTGFIDNKWEEYGWVNIENKPAIYSQAVFYMYLYHRIHGVLPDFYFAVFSTGKTGDAKLLKMNIPYEIEQLYKDVESSVDYAISLIEYQEAIGWPSSENFNHCIKCGWDACTLRLRSPKAKSIELINLKF